MTETTSLKDETNIEAIGRLKRLFMWLQHVIVHTWNYDTVVTKGRRVTRVCYQCGTGDSSIFAKQQRINNWSQNTDKNVVVV